MGDYKNCDLLFGFCTVVVKGEKNVKRDGKTEECFVVSGVHTEIDLSLVGQ